MSSGGVQARPRALIVVSSYRPVMIADMHRARQLAWELPALGWDVEVLTPDGSFQRPGFTEADSAPFFAAGTPVHEAPAWAAGMFRRLRIGTIGWRALIPLFSMGLRLLRRRRFDLVYISTTSFPLFLLGPAWRALTGAHYVLDVHDPIYRRSSSNPTWTKPNLKHALGNLLSGAIERISVRSASGIVAVSPGYIALLERHHGAARPPWSAGLARAIPFAVSPRDLELAGAQRTCKAGRARRIVYVGAGGPIMQRAFSLICAGLARLRAARPDLLADLHIELYGTYAGWREGDPRHLADVARAHGVQDLVVEDPRRVSYRRSLELLGEADGALVLGVQDPDYIPSKLFSYAFSGKPLLVSLHRGGSGLAHVAGSGLGQALWFEETDEIDVEVADAQLIAFLEAVRAQSRFDRLEALAPFGAEAMARAHSDLFDAIVRPGRNGVA